MPIKQLRMPLKSDIPSVLRLFPANSSLFKAGSEVLKHSSEAIAKSTSLYPLRARQLTNNFLCIYDAFLFIIITHQRLANFRRKFVYVFYVSVFHAIFFGDMLEDVKSKLYLNEVCLDSCSKLHYSYMKKNKQYWIICF